MRLCLIQSSLGIACGHMPCVWPGRTQILPCSVGPGQKGIADGSGAMKKSTNTRERTHNVIGKHALSIRTSQDESLGAVSRLHDCLDTVVQELIVELLVVDCQANSIGERKPLVSLFIGQETSRMRHCDGV
jgi:hypothetical protein